MYKLEVKPNKYESDWIDSLVYMMSAEMAKEIDGWISLHIVKKPWWIPQFIYLWLISKLFVINKFKSL